MSEIRRKYFFRLYARIIALILSVAAVIVHPEWFEVLDGWEFFVNFSPLHILWAVWMVDMVQQIIPVRSKIALGSQKLFLHRFRI